MQTDPLFFLFVKRTSRFVFCALALSHPLRIAVALAPPPVAQPGDGLVAARHLWQFGYWPTCVYPKPTPRQLFTNLVEQCTQLGIDFLPSCPAAEDLGRSAACAGLGGVGGKRAFSFPGGGRKGGLDMFRTAPTWLGANYSKFAWNTFFRSQGLEV